MNQLPHSDRRSRRWLGVAPRLPLTALRRVEVFSTEDTSAQLTWRRLPQGELVATIDGNDTSLGDASTPGAAEVDGLLPDSQAPVELHIEDDLIASCTLATQPSLEGPALSRIATINDLHLGEPGFGLVKRMRDHSGHADEYPLRCAKAAVREATAWGAELLVIKGDITHEGRPEEWEILDELLDDIDIPVIAIPGNHDTVGKRLSVDATDALRSRGLFTDEIQTADVAGARIVVADSTVPGRSFGRLRSRLDALRSAVDVDTPALVFTHHHLEATSVPWFWPLGIQRHNCRPVLDQMLEANPDLLVSSGHTHRNRARRHGTAVVTEVSSTKDHPGVWAGYVVHESGVRQVLRRVADTDCISWTDRTHAAVGGIWGRWSPGRLDDRSLTQRWTRSRRAQEPASTRRASATSAVS